MTSHADIDSIVSHLLAIIKDAADTAVPKKAVQLKGPRFRAPPHILTSMRNSRKAFKEWVDAGRPAKGAFLHSRMRQAKRSVRASLRQLEASKRNNFYSQLMSNPGNKQFHQMINHQRSDNSKLPDLIFDDQNEIWDPVRQADALASHYQRLATPIIDNKDFDDDYLCEAKRDNIWLLLVAEAQTPGPPFTNFLRRKFLKPLAS
jgi:hypothetical protein